MMFKPSLLIVAPIMRCCFFFNVEDYYVTFFLLAVVSRPMLLSCAIAPTYSSVTCTCSLCRKHFNFVRNPASSRGRIPSVIYLQITYRRHVHRRYCSELGNLETETTAAAVQPELYAWKQHELHKHWRRVSSDACAHTPLHTYILYTFYKCVDQFSDTARE